MTRAKPAAPVLTPEQRSAMEIARRLGRLRNYPGAVYYVAANKSRRDPMDYIHRPIIDALVDKGLLVRIKGGDVVAPHLTPEGQP